MKNIEISTGRLLLKPLSSEYLQTVIEYAMDSEIMYMVYLPNESIYETISYLRSVDLEWEKEDPEFYEFAIIYQNNHIGAISVNFENGIGELGWTINKKYRGNGFAYEAAEALVKYFAANFGTTHFVAHCDTENIASYKTMEKLGMIRTDEYGGRRNRRASHDSFEYKYELIL